MEFEYRRLDLEQALLDARTTDSLEVAMTAVANLVPELQKPEFFGRQMFCRELDATVPVLARRLGLADTPLTKNNDNVCIVGTGFYSHGGHSKVAEDISRLIGAERTTLILTDVYRERNHIGLLHMPKDGLMQRRATILLGAPTFVGKILELYNLLAAVRPSRIFLLTHHFDLVGLIALWPFREVVEFVHHVDYVPGLGATLPWSAHVDLTWTCHQICSAAGLSATYAGMTVGAEGNGPAIRSKPLGLPPKAPGTLRIATCGSLSKYTAPGAKRWIDYAIAALRLPRAELIHIGSTDDDFRAEVTASLAAAEIPPQRYIFAGLSTDVAADLKANEVDVYLSSYPAGGGKTNLEAISAGLAPIVPLDPDGPPLLPFSFPLENWIRIGDPSDLPEAVAAARVLGERMRADPGPLHAELARFETYVRSGG